MALNLDTTFKLKAKVEGARSVQDFKKQLSGLDKSSKMSKAQHRVYWIFQNLDFCCTQLKSPAFQK